MLTVAQCHGERLTAVRQGHFGGQAFGGGFDRFRRVSDFLAVVRDRQSLGGRGLVDKGVEDEALHADVWDVSESVLSAHHP